MMKIKFVSHASAIITTADTAIWSDPWLIGKAFNDSWSLLPEANFDISLLEKIEFLWISHEHPDHFHIPTLKSLPSYFKENVKILFQQNNSDKVINALKKMGYKHFIRLPHGKHVTIAAKTSVWCYQVGQMDSLLAVRSENQSVINLNDCDLNKNDYRKIKKHFSKFDVILNQFSMAGYNGYSDQALHLTRLAQSILAKNYEIMETLNGEKLIPFASMIYFSTIDNQYVNEYANTPEMVCDYFAKLGKDDKLVVLYPGDEYALSEAYDNRPALLKYAQSYQQLPNLPFDTPPTIDRDELHTSFNALYQMITRRFYNFVLRLFLRPMVIYIPDYQQAYYFDITQGRFYPVESKDYDLQIYSQPLNFAMKFDWGFQTLGVSARHIVFKNYNNYRRHRILFALNNAEIWLKINLLLNKKNWNWLRGRFDGLAAQIKQRYLSQCD